MWRLRLFFSLLFLVVHSPDPASGEKLSDAGTVSRNLFKEFFRYASNGSYREETTESVGLDGSNAEPFSFGSIWRDEFPPDSFTYPDYLSDLLPPTISFENDSCDESEKCAMCTSWRSLGYTLRENIRAVILYEPGYCLLDTVGGFAFEHGNKKLLNCMSLQDEIEHPKSHHVLEGNIGCFASVDVESYEDSNWREDMTFQAGLVFPNPTARSTWRLGFELGNSRSALGEFFRQREHHFAVELWVGF